MTNKRMIGGLIGLAAGAGIGHKFVPGTAMERLYTAIIGGAVGYIAGTMVGDKMETPSVMPASAA